MFMIFNLGGNSKSAITADTVEYGNSNVAQALGSLEAKDVNLTNSVSTLDTKVNNVSDSISGLEDELTANGNRIYLDYKDGKYGYNTDALRGADTFIPFKSGGGESDFTILNTRYSVAGNSLPTINGCGYCTLKRMTGENNNFMRVFIDGNTTGFEVAGGSTMGYFFQKSIRFESDLSSNTYLIQTLLADKTLADRYVITQGTAGEQLVDIRGKGKIIISSGDYNSYMNFYVDSGSSKEFTLNNEDAGVEILFTSRFRFKTDSEYYPLYYIAYVEL